jgi:hypothetical protein
VIENLVADDEILNDLVRGGQPGLRHQKRLLLNFLCNGSRAPDAWNESSFSDS